MPDTTVTIRKDGAGDYTTISSANAASDVSTGYYKMVVDDQGEYTSSINLTPNTGTATASNYVWLTVSEGNRHSGVAGTGHARIVRGPTLVILGDYSRLEYLELKGTAGGGQVVLVNGQNTLVSRCIIRSQSSITDYGIRVNASPGTRSAFVDNTLIYNVQYAGVDGIDNGSYSGSIYCDFVTIAECGVGGGTYRHVGLRVGVNTAGWSVNLYNCALAGNGVYDYSAGNGFTATGGWASITDAGSNNAWDNDDTWYAANSGSFSSSQTLSGGLTTTTTTANAMIVTDLTTNTEDYTPVVATGAGSNLLLGTGVNRQGSEPDSRQDFSTDIAGNPRPTKAGSIDAGAFQITVAAAGFKYWTGSAWDDATNVQYWNGSAWTDVTAVQYWNGSAWTDPS